MAPGEKLPVHGFVLAGGKSTRMGRDKALLALSGRPLVTIALEKLRTFCSEVSIAGNRDDLSGFAEVIPEQRIEQGPGAGVEAGLKACRQEWALFIPVDVPLVPASLLRRYAEAVIGRGAGVSNLGATFVGVDPPSPKPFPGGLNTAAKMIGRPVEQPGFCMLRAEMSSAFSTALDAGERRLIRLLQKAADLGNSVYRLHDVSELYGYPDSKGPAPEEMERFFLNVNTPADLASAGLWTSALNNAS